ncbi:hypothetical protein FHY13_002670 [Xanthomonas arboricola]|nr:hypothetical protein [Xanthomonas euroxanthea]
MPSPLAGHAVNPSMGARWRHPCRHTVLQSVRTPHQTVGRRSSESCLSCGVHQTWSRCFTIEQGAPSTALTLRIDHLDWSLPVHRRGTLSGMDAAPEPTWTYLRRVLRWWAGKDPAAKRQIDCSTADPSVPSKPSIHNIQSSRDLHRCDCLIATGCSNQKLASRGAVPSPLAGHAVNPSLGARWRHPCRHTVPQPARTPHQTVGRRSSESCL